MELFMNVIGNQLVQVVGGALAGIFVGGVAVWAYAQIGLSKIINEGGAKAGNVVGLFIYNNAIKHIKDNNLRKKIIQDLDTAGNDFDKGWDKGINGITI